jgi:hypothetical protein
MAFYSKVGKFYDALETYILVALENTQPAS